MANMILGMIIMGKRYTITKYLSITMISVGICICTIASSKDMEVIRMSTKLNFNIIPLWYFILCLPCRIKARLQSKVDSQTTFGGLLVRSCNQWCVNCIPFIWNMLLIICILGITILTFALFTSARMGLFQEVLYKKYGKHPREALFFTVLSITRDINKIWAHKNCIVFVILKN